MWCCSDESKHCCANILNPGWWKTNLSWMVARPKSNSDPHPSLQKAALIDHIQVRKAQISLSASVRDLGLVVDANLDMTACTSNMTRSCYCHLKSVGKLEPIQQAASAIAVSLIISRLDYSSSTLWGHPAYQLNHLLKIQNAADCIVTRTNFQEHISFITPVLRSLHWLPITKWTEYKIMSLIY